MLLVRNNNNNNNNNMLDWDNKLRYRYFGTSCRLADSSKFRRNTFRECTGVWMFYSEDGSIRLSRNVGNSKSTGSNTVTDMALSRSLWEIQNLHRSVSLPLPYIRGELSYLPPLGSENIAAPYFKQCFFQGGITPQTESNTTPPRPKTEITNILFYILNFASIIKFKM